MHVFLFRFSCLLQIYSIYCTVYIQYTYCTVYKVKYTVYTYSTQGLIQPYLSGPKIFFFLRPVLFKNDKIARKDILCYQRADEKIEVGN